MASEQVNVRVPDDELTMLDALAGALAREGAGNITPTIGRGDVVRLAIREAHERRAEQIAADHAAWGELVSIAGPSALLTLHGKGEGEPLPEERGTTTLPDGRTATSVTPPRWPRLAVTATVDGHPVDLRLIVEDIPVSNLVAVVLTDDQARARLVLGVLSRLVGPHPAITDRRLYSLAEELSLPPDPTTAGGPA